MTKVIIDNVFVTLQAVDRDTEFVIWDKLSFVVEEFGSPHVKIRHLYNRKTKKTYMGLLNYVIDILDERAIEYEIVDTRTRWDSNADFKLVDFVDEEKTIPLTFRPYQQVIVDRATERECIQAATGAGKTFMMAALIEKFNVKPVSVFADKLTLCEQLKTEFEKFLGIPIGLVGGGKNKVEDITIYSIQSASEDDVKDSKMIMFDECLTGDTVITMWNDQKFTIQEIVEHNIKMALKTYNIHTQKFESKYIYDYRKIPLKNKNKKIVKICIEDDNGNEHIIKCTEDHKIWIESEKEYIEAGKLLEDMEVICSK